MDLEALLEEKGQLFSEELGIDVEHEPFKWFIASVLFGGRIYTDIAKRTYREYETRDLTTPEAIDSAWRYTLIRAHGAGGYARYDGITADYMKSITKKLLDEYDGDMRNIEQESSTTKELEEKLEEFHGVGPVTVKIFLRELRGIWDNADPELSDIETMAAKDCGIVFDEQNATLQVKQFWDENAIDELDLRHMQAALVRHGLDIRRSE
jgi:3-hydroxyacyl-CoA dehydrogenase